MNWESYDPAIAANVIAVAAIIVAGLSLRLSLKTAKAAEEAKATDVVSKMQAACPYPGWLNIEVTCKNNSAGLLEVSQIQIVFPLAAVAVLADDLWEAESDHMGNVQRLGQIPIERVGRTLKVERTLQPSGTNGDHVVVQFYARVERSFFVRSLRFRVVFSSRKTDVRRFKRTVSPQMISVPIKHVD